VLEHVFLRDLVVVLAASFPVLWVCRRLRLPQIVGFLLTGVVIGPHALGWVEEARRVESIAEFGVALILLFVGLEFPLRRLKALGKTSLVGGSLQIALTALAVAAVSFALGSAPNDALFHGLLLSLSSTAVVLPVLKSRDELASPFGRHFLAVALFQDLAVIPMVLVLPALAAGVGPSVVAVGGNVLLAVGAIVLLVAAARHAAPRLLDAVARLGSRETFTGAVVVLVLGMIAIAERAGVSAAMGAFAAGIVLGESDHVHEVAATLSPIRDLLSSLFFVSVGMLLVPSFLARHPAEVAVLVVLVVAVKALAAFAALRGAGVVPRTAARSALALANVGEFSFVVATSGAALGLLTADIQQLAVAATVATLAVAPFLVSFGPRLAVRLPERVEPAAGEGEEDRPLSRHIVVVGAGLNGTNVARVLSETGISCVIVDIDPDRVAEARREGLRALRADATGKEGIAAAGTPRALGVVVTLPAPDAARQAVRLARAQNPAVRIIVRTRYIREVEALRAAGADEVIPEEFETSIELVARVLRLLRIPGNVVATQIRLLRDETYRRLRDPLSRVAGGRRLSALVAAGTSELFLVMPDTAADGRRLSELDLAAGHVAIPAVLRDGEPYAPPPPDWVVAAGDTLVLVGAHEDLTNAVARLETPSQPSAGTGGSGGEDGGASRPT
jgi:CPA2 family monovalent cation:H+ antiporter-2